VFAPQSAAEVASLLRECGARGEAVVLFGGGTLQGIGNLPARYDAAIALTGLAALVAYEHRDLTIAVEAGMTLETFDATLAEHGQFVPLDAPLPRRGTVGGALAAGWLGPRRATYGRPRDCVIGSGIALADGTLAKAGGMVVKNVTGYDMSKLYVGSLGTLGALVRANFKTLPLPQTRRVAIAALPEGTRRRAVAHLLELDIEPAAALVIAGFAKEIDGKDGSEGRVFLLLEGSHALVDRATRDVRSALGAAGVPETAILDRDSGQAFARVLDAYVARRGEQTATYRSFGLPSDAAARAEAFAELARAHDLTAETIADVRTGDAIARFGAATPEDLAARLPAAQPEIAALFPRFALLCAPEGLRAHLRAWGADPPALATMRALKDRFDPAGTLAPGRLP
jgi:glycolate oxidase FAD binding subunit